jgi:hypothetical protein
VLHDTVLRGEGLLVTWETLKDGLVLLVDSELLIVDAQLYFAILAALPCSTGVGLVEGLANAQDQRRIASYAEEFPVAPVFCILMLEGPLIDRHLFYVPP